MTYEAKNDIMSISLSFTEHNFLALESNKHRLIYTCNNTEWKYLTERYFYRIYETIFKRIIWLIIRHQESSLLRINKCDQCEKKDCFFCFALLKPNNRLSQKKQISKKIYWSIDLLNYSYVDILVLINHAVFEFIMSNFVSWLRTKIENFKVDNFYTQLIPSKICPYNISI